MNYLSKKIKERREELGLSQEELARKIGYKSRSTIAKIESGENDIPQSKISQFADALDTTEVYLMGWESNPDKNEESKKFYDAAIHVANHFGVDIVNEKYNVSFQEYNFINLYKGLSKENQSKLNKYIEMLYELQIKEKELFGINND